MQRREHTETEMHQPTDQGRRALEQTIEVQRNTARMMLSILEWQETAQTQGLEFTKSMFRSYVEGVEAMLPEMRQAVEEGQEAMRTGMEATQVAQAGPPESQSTRRTGGLPPEQQTGEWTTRESLGEPVASGQGTRRGGETSGRRRSPESARQRAGPGTSPGERYSKRGGESTRRRGVGTSPADTRQNPRTQPEERAATTTAGAEGTPVAGDSTPEERSGGGSRESETEPEAPDRADDADSSTESTATTDETIEE